MTTRTKRTAGVRKTHTLHSFGDQRLINVLSSVMGAENLDQYRVYRYLQSDRGTNIQKREGFLDINKNFTSEKHLFYTETIWISSVNLNGSMRKFESLLMTKFKLSYGLDLTFEFRSGRMRLIDAGGIKKVYKQVPARIKPFYDGYVNYRFDRLAKVNFALGNMSKSTFNNLINGDYYTITPSVERNRPVGLNLRSKAEKKKKKMEAHLKEFNEFRAEWVKKRNRPIPTSSFSMN